MHLTKRLPVLGILLFILLCIVAPRTGMFAAAPVCPYIGDAKTYSQSGKCYSAQGTGFNTHGGNYSCGPVACPPVVTSSPNKGNTCEYIDNKGHCYAGWGGYGFNPSIDGGCHYNQSAPTPISCPAGGYGIVAQVVNTSLTPIPNVQIKVNDNGHGDTNKTSDSSGKVSINSWNGDHVIFTGTDPNYTFNKKTLDTYVNTGTCGSDLGLPARSFTPPSVAPCQFIATAGSSGSLSVNPNTLSVESGTCTLSQSNGIMCTTQLTNNTNQTLDTFTASSPNFSTQPGLTTSQGTLGQNASEQITISFPVNDCTASVTSTTFTISPITQQGVTPATATFTCPNSITPTQGVTPTITSGTTPTATITPGGSPNPGATGTIAVHLQGIDSNNNSNPNHQVQRKLTVDFYNSSNNNLGGVPDFSVSDFVHYNASDGSFISDSFPLSTIPAGQYYVLTRSPDGSLRQALNNSHLITINAGSVTALTSSPLLLPMGDINADNAINLNDYSILVDCFGSKHTAGSNACAADNVNNVDPNLFSDLNDDGAVDLKDYNILIRNFGVSGQ